MLAISQALHMLYLFSYWDIAPNLEYFKIIALSSKPLDVNYTSSIFSTYLLKDGLIVSLAYMQTFWLVRRPPMFAPAAPVSCSRKT
jgi:hypothetical protein